MKKFVKRFLSVLLAISMLFTIVAFNSQEVFADGQNKDFRYYISNGQVRITEYIGKENNVVVPSEIDGCPVVSLEEFSFKDNEKIESVKLPNSIKEIKYGAFEGDINLKEINIPDSVEYMVGAIFSGCKSLTSLVIPGSAKLHISYEMVSGCENLESIEIKGENEDFTTIDGILYNKDKTILIVCPEGRKDDVDIPDTVKKIEDFAFCGCIYIKNIKIPESVNTIGDAAFATCKSLTSITIPRSVESIGDGTFSDKKGGIKEIWVYKNSYAHKYLNTESPDERLRVIKDDSPLDTPRINAMTNGNTSIRVALLNKIDDADGYELYRATSENGKYYLKKTFDGKFDYINTGLTTGKTYYYKARAYKVVNGKTIYSSYSKVVSAKAALKAPLGVNAESKTYNSIKITWDKVAGASGYEIYRATSLDGKYSSIKRITSPYTTSYTNTGLKTGKTYYYKVKAYKVVNGNRVYSKIADRVYATPRLNTPVIKVKAGTNKATVSWNKVSGAYGYKVYRATSENGTYYLKKTVNSSSSLSYTNTGLTKGKTYYYKVRAYRVVDGKNVYSSYSTVKSVKI